MDSWTLQEDSYSFLRSAPQAFSLCHRDGTPNHVEIFDIINAPSQRSAISETTCLCDIFGDDCDSPSLSSSPAVGPFVPPLREVNGTAAASPLVDDLNESSGSYHSTQATSEGEDIFEDSGDRLYSPSLKSESSEKRSPDLNGLSSGLAEVTKESKPNLEQNSNSPLSHFSTASPSSEFLSSGERTPSPGHSIPYTLSQDKTASSSSSVEKGCSPPPPDSTQVHSGTDRGRITPTFREIYTSLSHQSLISSLSPEPRNGVSLSFDLVDSQSLPEFRIAQVSPEPRSSHYNRKSSLSPEPTPEDFTLDLIESAFESRAILSSPSPSSSSTELLFQSREALVSLELKGSSLSPETQEPSPFTELRGRVSLPDLLSRGSTPDIEDSTHTPELISDISTKRRDTTATPESQGTRLSAVSTPAPRYTPPSPVISRATSPELVESCTSPESSHTAHSPDLLSAAFPAKTETRTPSPGPSHTTRDISTPSEIKTKVSSPVLSHSVSPSPEVTRNNSPSEHSDSAPSPEVRITLSSPEVSRREQSSEAETKSASPLLEPDFDSSRSLTSSPHITGISYSVVQPEDRQSPPFPELSHLSTPEADRTLVSPDARSLTPSTYSIAESTSTPVESPHICTSSVVQPETVLSNQTSSPQPKEHTPSPEPRYTLSSDKYQSFSPQPGSNNLSPVAPSPEPRCHQQSSTNLNTENNPEDTPLRNTPGFEGESSSVNITEKQTKDRVSSPLELDRGDKSVVPETESRSPAVAAPSPISTSPVSVEGKVDNSPKKHSTEREEIPKEANIQDNSRVVFSEEKQAIGPTLKQIEDTRNKLPIESKSPSPNLLVSEDKRQSLSPIHRVPSKVPEHRLEDKQPQVISFSPTPENSSSLTSSCASERARRQPSASVRRDSRERVTEDMAHHLNRRRTPSPPLTRFTPVHIIAPEKPHRHWQSRSHSSSLAVASSPSGNLKKVVTNRESPNLVSVDNNSQANQGRLGTQLEMEREMLLEEDRKVGRERWIDRGMEREKKREEELPEKGTGWQGDTSYRGEQVELSFNARNRKGPVSRRRAPTSRETRQGPLTGHSYSESLLAARQLQQQQSLQRLASQQDIRGGSSGRQLQPPSPQNKNSAPGLGTVNRPCQSSSSSMGSELDEADNEVKWFTDVAFSSLSSPEVDYLDMYNSSHRSSTNISQPSTQESTAGVNTASMAYADFRGSAPKLDNEELALQHMSAHFSDGLDPLRRFDNEMGSFECIDVAVEKEDSRKVRRGVPKRQIQLKRKDITEGKQDGSSENSSPGVLMMMESPSLVSHSRETFVRQHSTPATLQECYSSECSPENYQQNKRKPRLKKSASLDETCNKNKMATCLIKSVLSKKMISVDKDPDDQEGEVSHTFEENSPEIENAVAAFRVSPKADTHNLSSSRQSDYSISSDCLSVRGEPSAKDEAKPPKHFGVRSSNRPSSSSSSRSVNLSQTESQEADSLSRNATSLRSEMISALKVPSDGKRSSIGVQQADDSKIWEAGDSANAIAMNTGAPSDTGASSMQARATKRDQECENTEGRKQLQQGDKGVSRSKKQEITFKAVEKKKASLNVCLTPEAENKREDLSSDMSHREREERTETRVDEKTEEEEENVNNQVKVPIHKVRDVRQLVKNTYNLSFKATGAVMTSNVNDKRIGNFNDERGGEFKEERREEAIAGEEKDAMKEIGREEKRQEKEDKLRVEKRDERKEEVKDSNLTTLSRPLQSKGSPQSRPQPMQIEYKAVCWKENRNETSCSPKVSDNPGDTLQNLKLSTELNRESHTAVVRSGQQDTNLTEEREVPDKEDNRVVVGTVRKPPVLGGLPRLPSKEREVSTAVVLIRDGSSKTKTAAPAAPEETPIPLQAPAASPSPGHPKPGDTHARGGRSVSMLLKEKDYQADIGAVVGNNHNAAGGKGLTCKHVNCLEIPLQTTTTSDGGPIQSQRERTFSSSSATSGPLAVSDNTDTPTKTGGDEGTSVKRPIKDTARQNSVSLPSNTLEQPSTHNKLKDLSDFEAVKRLDPTFPPKSPAIRRFRPQSIEVKSLSKDIQKQEIPTNPSGNKRPQTIEVKSIAKNTQKPAVPPKPSCRFKPADIGAMPNEAQKPSATTSTVGTHGEERSQTIVVSSPTIYRKISNDSTSNYTRKLSVSTISSLKPPPLKTTATTIPNLSHQSTAPPGTEASHDSGQQQKPETSPQSSGYINRPTTLATSPTSATGPGLTTAPGPALEPKPYQLPGTASAGAYQPCQPPVRDPDSQPQHSRMSYPHEQPVHVTPNKTRQPPAASTTQVPEYTHQPCRRSFSSEHPHRTDDLRFYGSDDPPSYDERESFSPLMLPDLTPRRSNRYQPSSRPPPCSCTATYPSHPGLPPPHNHRSPHSLTPPAPSHSPGQALPYTVAQPPNRPHQCRSDPQQLSYQPASPKSSPLGPSQPPTVYQPLHQPPPCPPHPSLMQPCPADRSLQPPQPIDSRRPPVHRSPQHHPPGMAPYNEPGHSHSPGLPPVDPQYLCGPQSLGPSYGSEYGGDGSSLYSETSYGQTPRRVLLDPETGKYFYIEVPVQPLRKMLFDPETGQYVEVLIPQQAMSHSGLYPPSAVPYPSLHNPNMYAPSPQYMPYAAPPPAQAQADQPPRYPVTSAAPTMHPVGPGVSYRNPSDQAPKPESQNHQQLDQNYLESMYYVPTGINASPNPTPPDYYHKNPPNLPPTGGLK